MFLEVSGLCCSPFVVFVMSQIFLIILVPSSLPLPLGVRNKPEINVTQTKGSDHPQCKLDMLVNLHQMMGKEYGF